MKAKTSIQIGKKFANWANHQIEQAGLGLAANTPGSGSGLKKGDSYNTLDFLFEFKSERQPAWKGNIEQARHQASIGNKDWNKWVLVQRDPDTSQENPKAFAIIDYIEFLELLKRNQEPKIKEPDRQVIWKIKRLIESAKQVLKELEC